MNLRLIDRTVGYHSPAALLVAAVAWGAASRGGTGGRDQVIILVLLIAALLAAWKSAGVDRRSRPVTAGTVMFVALEGWLIVAGPLRFGIDLDTMRLPVLALAAYLTVCIIGFLDLDQRAWVLHALIMLGSIHALVAIGETVANLASNEFIAPQNRADSLVGYSNALGILLVATAAITMREMERRRTPVLAASLFLQAVALLLTGSRIALLAALCVVGWYCIARRERRTRVIVVPFVVLAILVVWVRFASAPPTRLQLWRAAVEQIAFHPIAGSGPAAQVLDVDASGVRATTHAHNEALQVALEYGLIGLALVAGTLIFAVTHVLRRKPHDPWLVAAAASLLASGLTDFSLRITVVAVATAATAACCVPPMRPRRDDCNAGAVTGKEPRPMDKVPSYSERTDAAHLRLAAPSMVIVPP